MDKTQLNVGRLALLVAIIVASVVLWDSPVLLPFKLLAVMGHETGHALASLIVGGSVTRVSLSPDEAGQCLSMIPEGFFRRTIVSSGGYVGGSLFGVLLLVLTYRFNARRIILGVACVWLGLMGLLFARDAFTLAFCLVMAIAFGAGAKWLPEAAVGGLNLFLATFQALYAVMDLKDDLGASSVRAQSDAAILASSTGVPAVVWAVLWTLVSLAIVGLGGWLALREPRKVTALA